MSRWNHPNQGFKKGHKFYGKVSTLFIRGKHISEKTEFKKGNIPWNKGKKGLQIGHLKGQKRLSMTGNKHPLWKGGRIESRGYVKIYNPKHPHSANGYVLEHRLVMERYLDRYLTSTEIVHHINEIKNDNRLSNLMLFKNGSEHKRYHKWIRLRKNQQKLNRVAKNANKRHKIGGM